MPVWCVSQRVAGALDGCFGTVISVDINAGTFTVDWTDDAVVVYPEDTIMVRRTMPWET
jgi:hypothetical protein